MTRYAKAIVAVIGVLTMFVFKQWGAEWGLDSTWPETAALVLTPIAVWFFPNK